MTVDLFSLSLFNIVINSLLAFLTAWLLIELFLLLFRITHPRLQASFKLIPIFKLPLVVLFMNWSNWAILQQIYPWECPVGSRLLSVSIGTPLSWIDLLQFPFSLKIGLFVSEGFSFSLADVCAHFLGKISLFTLSIAFLLITSLKLLKTAIHLFRFSQKKRVFLSACKPLESSLQSPLPLYENAEYRGSPFIVGIFKPKMIFPKSIELSSEEFAAVVAHEVEHAKRFDPLNRALLSLISQFFWWIPMKWLLQSIREKQEWACDLASRRSTSSMHLASALVKVARQTDSSTATLGISLLKPSTLKKRVALLLSPTNRKIPTFLKALTLVMFIPLATLIFFGKFWGL